MDLAYSFQETVSFKQNRLQQSSLKLMGTEIKYHYTIARLTELLILVVYIRHQVYHINFLSRPN